VTRLFTGLAALLLSVAVQAAGSVEVIEPWAASATAAQAEVYMTLRNAGTEQDRLVGASSPLATSVQLRAVVQLGSAHSIQPLKSIGIPPGGQHVLAPGHTHLLLVGLRRPLVAGDQVPLTLQFEKAGRKQIQAQVP
jgi:copper(I)-binding protein